jgi:hypothetical protein
MKGWTLLLWINMAFIQDICDLVLQQMDKICAATLERIGYTLDMTLLL